MMLVHEPLFEKHCVKNSRSLKSDLRSQGRGSGFDFFLTNIPDNCSVLNILHLLCALKFMLFPYWGAPQILTGAVFSKCWWSGFPTQSRLWAIYCAMQTSQVARLVKNPPANARDVRAVGSVSGSGTSPGEANGNPLQYSCLENPVDRGTW